MIRRLILFLSSLLLLIHPSIQAVSDIHASIDRLIGSFTPVTPSSGSRDSSASFLSISSLNSPNLPNLSGSKQQQQPTVDQRPLNGPSISLANGTALGRLLTLSNLESPTPVPTNQCHIFLGIPYAAPPVDQWRFKAPRPAPKWSGVYQALKYKPACTQDSKALPKGWSIDEDCLHVNIFKPATSNPLSVVIWIHGGGFLMGSATTLNPAVICRQAVINNVVIITANYRLGAFGFLASDMLQSTDHNVGVRDLVQVVRWTQDNAENLGTSGIVLAGHGAGAAMVSHLLNSGLIDVSAVQGAIMMSGSGQAPWAITTHSRRSTDKLLKLFNCAKLDCLQKVPRTKIAEQPDQIWSPYVDDTVIFANDTRRVHIRRNFPMIIGFTAQEGTAIAVQKLAPVTEQPLKEKVTRSIVDLTGKLKDDIDRIYMQERPLPVNFFDSIYDFVDALSEAYSDVLFKAPSIQEATLRTKNHNSNIYVYMIRNDVPLPNNLLPGYKASYHGSDMDLFWSPYAKQSRVNLLGAFLHVLFHQDEALPWRPWTQQSPVILQITPYGGQFAHYRPVNNSWSLLQSLTGNNRTTKPGSTMLLVTPRTKLPHVVSTTTIKPMRVTLSSATVSSSTRTTTATTTLANSAPSVNKTNKIDFDNSTNGNGTSRDDIGGNSTSTTVTVSTKITTTAATTSGSSASTVSSTASTVVTTTVRLRTLDTTSNLESSTVDDSSMGNATGVGGANRAANANASDTSTTPTSQQDSLVWVLLGLAVLFLLLFLLTVGGCAAWNRQSYHPHPNRRSRHQGARVRTAQAPPPVAPLQPTAANRHAHRPVKENAYAEPGVQNGNGGGRRAAANANNSTSRRPRQPPPSLPPLLSRDKRNQDSSR